MTYLICAMRGMFFCNCYLDQSDPTLTQASTLFRTPIVDNPSVSCLCYVTIKAPPKPVSLARKLLTSTCTWYETTDLSLSGVDLSPQLGKFQEMTLTYCTVCGYQPPSSTLFGASSVSVATRSAYHMYVSDTYVC